MLLDPKSITENSLQEIASFSDAKGGLEYAMIPTKDGVVLFSASRHAGIPFMSDGTDRKIRRMFPLSLVLKDKDDPELKRAFNQARELIGVQYKNAEWGAHWHPKGSAADEQGDFPSSLDFNVADIVRKVQLMFDEKSIFVYGAQKGVADMLMILRMEAYDEHLPEGQRENPDSETLKKAREYKQAYAEQQGMICTEIPWGTPMAEEVLSVIRGEKKIEDIWKRLFPNHPNMRDYHNPKTATVRP